MYKQYKAQQLLELQMREHGMMHPGNRKKGPFKHRGHFIDQSGGAELYQQQQMMGFTGQEFFKSQEQNQAEEEYQQDDGPRPDDNGGGEIVQEAQPQKFSLDQDEDDEYNDD